MNSRTVAAEKNTAALRPNSERLYQLYGPHGDTEGEDRFRAFRHISNEIENRYRGPGEQRRTKRDSNSLQGTAPLRTARASIAYLCENEFGTGTYNGDQSVKLFRDGKKNWRREMADGAVWVRK